MITTTAQTTTGIGYLAVCSADDYAQRTAKSDEVRGYIA